MFVKVLFGIFLCFFSAFADRSKISDSNGADRLIFAQIIYRHGARNIIKPYINDPWGDESNWPGGYGALTNEGKRQSFELGQFFRNRYLGNLIGNGEYTPDKVYVLSSDTPRTMMSAAVNLAGLFPPNSNQQWNKDILWQPIPIHNLPLPPEKDYYIHILLVPCERFDHVVKPIIEENIEFSKDLLKQLEKILKKPISLEDAHFIYDGLCIESFNNMTLPVWAKEVFYPGCDLEKVPYNYFKRYTQTKELTRLRSGFILREIMDRFLLKANSTLKPDYNLYMYSAHDITIASVLNIFGLYEGIAPDASALMLELNQSNNGYYVQIFYRNSTTENHLLNIPNCGTKCPLERLYQLSQPYFPENDFETGCKLRDDDRSSSTMLSPILSVSWILVNAIFVITSSIYM